MSNNKYDLIIFDCDGTIADSEYLNCLACSIVLKELGYERYTTEDVYNDFVGKTLKAISDIVVAEYGIPMVDDFVKRIVDKVLELTPQYLKEVPRVNEAIGWAYDNYKICVASNGEPVNVHKSVDTLDLRKYFPKNKIFTQAQVKIGKPAPDLFLLAANEVGGTPERTLVVEDTVVGITAAKAAGMSVIGFTALHSEKPNYDQKLLDAGADHIMNDWSEFKALAQK